MAKTYNTFTNVSTGDVLTATNFNNVLTNVAGYRVPSSAIARRTTDSTGYASNTNISWESILYDTGTADSPSDPMWALSPNPSRITIKTAGIYLVSLTGYVTGTATMTSVAGNLKVNNASVAQSVHPVITAGTESTVSTSATLSLAVNDYVEASFIIVGGSAYVVKGSATSQNFGQTRLCVTWLGQTS